MSNRSAKSWPLVDPWDDGIRPAGLPDHCFYCGQRVGKPHGPHCVIVTKVVELRVRVGDVEGPWITTVPHAWDEEDIRYRYNDSTWCAGNLFDEDLAEPLASHLAAMDPDGCICDMTTVSLARVVDDTPTREVRT